jgi:glycosyltransferase involved in cell wall biosynthesis
MSSGSMLQSPERRLAYFALDVPHKGQASHIHINEMIGNLRRLGWQVDLFAPEPASDSRARRPLERLFIYSRVTLRLLRQLHGYDALYVRAHPLAWPVTFWARARKRVIAQEINGVELDVIVSHPWLTRTRPLVRWLYRSQYSVSDRLLPVTNELARWLADGHPGDRITVIANGANTDLFRPIERDGDPFVAFFGGLTSWHGVDLMLDAVRHPRWPAGVELLVIGAGAQEHKVREAVQAGLPVRWLGYRPHEQIPDLIAGAIAGLIPITNPQGRSSTGVSPLKLYETLACGIPVIATDLPGQAEIVRAGDCGLVIPCDDPAALAGAVAQLSADPTAAREMGRRGAELVRTKHSWAARAAEVDRILRGALAQPAIAGAPGLARESGSRDPAGLPAERRP